MLDGRPESQVRFCNCCVPLFLDEELVEDVSLSWSLTVSEVGLKEMFGGRSKQSFNGNEGKDRFRSTLLLSWD